MSTTEVRVVVLRDTLSLPQAAVFNEERGKSEYFYESNDLNCIVLKVGEKLPAGLIRAHVRVLSRDSMTPLPSWFEEGMAEYFSNYKLPSWRSGMRTS